MKKLNINQNLIYLFADKETTNSIFLFISHGNIKKENKLNQILS